MPVRYYPAILERVSDGFGVYFPDLPGCVSAGDTMAHAAEMAEEALALHLVGMAQDGDPIPEPTPLEQVGHDPEVNEAGRLLVRAELPGRSVRVNVTFDESLLAAADAAAARRGQSRSGFLAEALRGALKGA